MSDNHTPALTDALIDTLKIACKLLERDGTEIRKAVAAEIRTLLAAAPAAQCSSFCAPGESCSVTEDGKCDVVSVALENIRLFAARHRKEEWAATILRFCAEAGHAGNPLRAAPAAPAAQPAEFRECRHCGWQCRPNDVASKKWHPLEQEAQPAAPQGQDMSNDSTRSADMSKSAEKSNMSAALGDVVDFAAMLKAHAAAMAAPQGQKPVAWMWQHEETGNSGFVDAWQVENGWQQANSRRKLIHPLFTAPPAPSIPPGWKLVPVEPTEAMLEAAHKSDREYTLRNFGDVETTVQQGPYDHWCAMIDAAPSTETPS